jgi:plasmid stabilization system protein ParE
VAVVWTERSRDDLIDIFRFIARDDRRAAERWIARLEDA